MSMPGRFFIQRFLSHAVRAGCTTVILEMTSEGARQYRHQCIDLDALVFTNLAPEHIESHGSYKAYAEAKFEIGRQLVRSSKCPRIIVANRDDAEAPRYLSLPVEKHFAFSLSAASPREATEILLEYCLANNLHLDKLVQASRASLHALLQSGAQEASEEGGCFTFDGEKITVHLPGEFSLRNALAAATLARAFGVGTSAIAHALDKLTVIPGRGERIAGKQDFTVVVDYAHTPDSLRALYDAYKNKRKICVLGATGGGRDAWKRPVMGKIADENCDEVILTDEDPYDEDPYAIVKMVAKDMKRTPGVIMDRREAIRGALARAKSGDAVLITGKGTDPNICGPRGTKTPWSDADIVREELEKLKAKTV